MGTKFVWKEKKKEPGKFGLYLVVGKNILEFIRNATEGEIERSNLDVLFMDKEKRVVCGKARTCKLSGGKVIEVYDDDKKVYVPFDEFLRQQEEYKTNPIVDDTLDIEKKKDEKKDEKKEYFTTHGKKIKETKEDKKVDKQIVPSNTVMNSNINLSTSGTSGLDVSIPNVPDINVNVNTEKEKDYEKESDPYEWFIKRVLRRV